LLQPWKLREVARVPGVTQAGGAEVPLARGRRSDVGDDKVKAPGRAGRGRRDVRAELNRTPRAGRCELDAPEAVIEREVRVEPPPEAPVELLRAIDIETGMMTASSFRSTSLMARDPARVVAPDTRRVIAASLGGVRDDRRAVTAASHQAHTLVCVLRRPRSRIYVRAGTGGKGSFGTSPVSPHSMDRGCMKRSQIDSALSSSFPAAGPEWTGQVTVASATSALRP
jgi:hypothetical protein